MRYDNTIIVLFCNVVIQPSGTDSLGEEKGPECAVVPVK